jgi:hypothetical protein
MGAHGGAGFGLIPRDDRGEDAAVFLLDKLHPLAWFAERQVPRQVKAGQDVRLHRGARSCEILVAGRLADRLMKGLVRLDTQLSFANAAVQFLEMRAQLGQIRFCMAHGGKERRLPSIAARNSNVRWISAMDPTGAKVSTAVSGRRCTNDPDPCRDTTTPSSRSCLSA